jgi:hypothetical protein
VKGLRPQRAFQVAVWVRPISRSQSTIYNQLPELGGMGSADVAVSRGGSRIAPLAGDDRYHVSDYGGGSVAFTPLAQCADPAPSSDGPYDPYGIA